MDQFHPRQDFLLRGSSLLRRRRHPPGAEWCQDEFVDYGSPVPLQGRCAISTEEEQPVGPLAQRRNLESPGGCRVNEATTPLYLSAAPRGTGGSSTLASYAVWESAERFARVFDTID